MKSFFRMTGKGCVTAGKFVLGAYGLIFVLYVVGHAALTGKAVDFDEIRTGRNLAGLQYRMPSLKVLSRMQEEHRDADIPRLRRYADYFGRMVRFTRHKGDAYAWQGFCYYLMHQPRDAARCYRQAVEQDPGYFWHHYNLGVVLFEGGDYRQAVGAFKDALATNPYVSLETMRSLVRGSPDLLRWRLPHLSTEDHMLKLNGHLRRGYASCFRLLVLSLYRTGNYQEMLSYAFNAVELDSNDKEVFYLLGGIAAYKLKTYTLALNLLDRYLKDHPDDPEGLEYWALTVRALGREKLASRVMGKAAALEKTGGSILDAGLVAMELF